MATDWWSCAVLTHEMLSRATPFEAEGEINQQMIFELVLASGNRLDIHVPFEQQVF
ncbi:hypothetical protein L798_13266 [Zootermopsis nevadensis]|uniref:Protein kinase domain-containing protein n=1 Tax=Zootermopsis nevadensis TaxID=136037 RepID=A0A067QT20_ZOONE|nr:hypothetical protein L798_13266 [Zootermopsis nevadensis]